MGDDVMGDDAAADGFDQPPTDLLPSQQALS
jgi:hypothetical protein